jgi:PAS domain S-box-containing protein
MGNLQRLGSYIVIICILLIVAVAATIGFSFTHLPYREYYTAGSALLALILVILLVVHIVNALESIEKALNSRTLEPPARHPLANTIWQLFSPLFQKLNEATRFVKDIGSGNKPKPFVHLTTNDPIGAALVDMNERLSEFHEEDRKRNWISTGLARFSEILRLSDENIRELSTRILSNIVQYMGANQGSFFIEYEDEQGEKYLELTASYAYDKKEDTRNKIYAGQGLLGECMRKHETIFLTEVPPDFVSITSGLGEATPRNIVIVPLLMNEVFYGAVEIASFTVLEKYQVDFLQELTESIASVIATVKNNEHTRKLLAESQQKGNELRIKEEELRQSMEELQSIQEEVLRHKQTELSGVFSAIDHTLGMAEFDTEGNIIKANNTLLNTFRYDPDEIQQLASKLLASHEQDMQVFWRDLKNNIPKDSDLKTSTKNGTLIWLNTSYTPVLDAGSGQVTKILMLAQNITEKKQKETEFQRQLETINKTLASVEFNIDSTINDCNQIYLDMSGYKAEELIGKPYSYLLSEEDIPKPQTLMMWNSLQEGNFFSGEFRQKAKNGTALWLLGTFNPIRNDEGKPEKIKMFAQIITQEKEKQNDLARISFALKNSVLYLELNEEGLFKSANELFFKDFGYSRTELRQKPFTFLLSDSYTSAEAEKLFETFKVHEFHEELLTLKTKDGSEKPYKATFTPIRNLENKFYKTALVLIEKSSVLI